MGASDQRVEAGLIASWTFGQNGTGHPQTAFTTAPAFVEANLTASNWSAAGTVTATSTYDGNAQTNRSAYEPVGIFRPGNSVTTVAGQVTGGNYAYVQLTIAPGYFLNLSNVTFDYSRGGTSVATRSIGFNTSLDSAALFVDNMASITANNRPNFKSANIDLSGSMYQMLTGTVQMRFYTANSDGNASTGHDIDNIKIFGEIVPEPSAVGLALIGLAGLLASVRCRRRSCRAKP